MESKRKTPRLEINLPAIAVGDCIKAFDFEPIKGRPDCYVVGIVREIGWIRNEYIGYTIDCVYDSMPEAAGVNSAVCTRVGRTVYVPVQTLLDYDGRVTRI
jgi:hypothetical protein